jgi:hypothetical protein
MLRSERQQQQKKRRPEFLAADYFFFPFPDYYFLCAALLVFRQLDLISNSALILCVCVGLVLNV